jgi:hypothetical protein
MDQLFWIFLAYVAGILSGRSSGSMVKKEDEVWPEWQCAVDGCNLTIRTRSKDVLQHAALLHAKRHAKVGEQ